MFFVGRRVNHQQLSGFIAGDGENVLFVRGEITALACFHLTAFAIDFHIGSTAEQILLHSAADILVVKPENFSSPWLSS